MLRICLKPREGLNILFISTKSLSFQKCIHTEKVSVIVVLCS